MSEKKVQTGRATTAAAAILAVLALALTAGLNYTQADAPPAADAATTDAKTDTATDAAQPAAAAEGVDNETPLAEKMEEMEDIIKKLRRSLKKPEENADSLASISQLQEATIFCKAQTPAMAASVPEADRAKFVAGYRKDMAAVLVELVNMEVAVLDGNNDAASDILKKLGDLEDAGHEKYTPQE